MTASGEITLLTKEAFGMTTSQLIQTQKRLDIEFDVAPFGPTMVRAHLGAVAWQF